MRLKRDASFFLTFILESDKRATQLHNPASGGLTSQQAGLRDGVRARKDFLRRAGHVQMIIRLTPLDDQITTRQRHRYRRGFLDAPRQNGRDGQRARTGATSEGGACTALPHLHHEVRGALHLQPQERHARVGPLTIRWVPRDVLGWRAAGFQ